MYDSTACIYRRKFMTAPRNLSNWSLGACCIEVGQGQ